jgi:GNAT superfamily N-acetyltransferase
MVVYRTFRNTDPPAIVSLWRSRAGQPGLLHSVSADLFEQYIFGKVYFDYEGLVLAFEDGQALGFAHAGFGPDGTQSRLTTERGVTCVVILNGAQERAEVADGLLLECERYLSGRGAKVLYGGGLHPLNPFYVGLYGGSELPGVLHSDTLATELFLRHEYREADQVLVFQRNLDDFKPPVDRLQVQLRRQMTMQSTVDWPTQTWWQACTIGDFDLIRFDALPRGGGPVLAHALFRSMEPPGGAGFVRAVGLIDLAVHPSYRHRGLATYLLTEAFHNFHRQGITIVQSQATAGNAEALGLYKKLGLEQSDRGSVFRKERQE